MKLVRFGPVGGESVGALTPRGIVPLAPVLRTLGLPCSDLNAVFALWTQLREVIENEVASHASAIAPESVRLGAPLASTANIYGVGKNYRTDTGGTPGVDPVYFIKSASALNGPHDTILRPQGCSELDFEAELAIIIGRGGRNIALADAPRHIAGFAVANDVTAPGLMFPGHLPNPGEMGAFKLQMLAGKASRTFLPIGPCVVTADEFGGFENKGIVTRVNGEVRQSAQLTHMILGIDDIVSHISTFVDLQPGDAILTGTPAGIGWDSVPPVWLEEGDLVEITIDAIGTLANLVGN